MRDRVNILVIFFACVISAQSFSQALQQNHSNANLPSTYEEFTNIVQRDLVSYFSKIENEKVSTSYELLRKQPTQSGIAYPKFYAWVIVSKNNKVIKQGAIRLAAINGTKVEVTDFIQSNVIMAKPKSIESVFPKSLCDDIRQRASKT